MQQEIYIVTGATGHLGNVIVQKLAERNKKIRGLVLKGETATAVPYEIVYGNVCDKDSLRPLFRRDSKERLIVIHCAAIVSIASKNFAALREVNVGGTQNIVDLCAEYNVDKLVHVSSVHAIPEKPFGALISETDTFSPELVEGDYAKTKAEATAYVLQAAQNGLNACVVHPSGIIGPYDNGKAHMTSMAISFLRGKLPCGVKGGYDFVDVRDVAGGVISCCEKGRSGECYILSGQYYEVGHFLNVLGLVSHRRKALLCLPLWLARVAAPLGEKFSKTFGLPMLFTPYSIYTLGTNAFFSHEKATLELGYNPRPLWNTLEDTTLWLRSVGRVPAAA